MENVVEVGGYLLDPSNSAGTLVREGEAGAGSVESLQRAFDAANEQGTEGTTPNFADEVEGASESTAKIERAVALCKGIGEGQALNPAQLGLEVGALLDCLERLDRKKEHKKSLQMARALATLLMLLKRWADLLQTLRLALRAGETLGDQAAVAWARHELGTLRLAAGDVEGADRDLCRAREIRERIGDRRGLAATERNMAALCDRVRSMLRDEQLVRRGARSEKAPTRMLALAGALAIFFGGGVAAGALVGGDSGGSTTAAADGTRAAATSDVSPTGTETSEITSPTETETIPPPTETTLPTTEITETLPPRTPEPSVPPPVANTDEPPEITTESGPVVK